MRAVVLNGIMKRWPWSLMKARKTSGGNSLPTTSSASFYLSLSMPSQIYRFSRLAELMHNLLKLTLAPHVPASLRNIPTKYNIIIRLWTHAFNKPLEQLRRASFTSVIALEHLQEYIIYAYSFYTMLLEEQTLESFKSGWLEALGDLARYCMAIAAMTNPLPALKTGEFVPVNEQALAAQTQPDESMAPVDESPGPSVGVAAARLLELEPEKERWRCIARDWYAAGLTDMPGTGKLHHHLGLLSRDVGNEELRSVYHFCKR
jgi:protein SMG6